MVVLLRPTACSTPASQFSMVASLRSQSSLEMLPASLGSSAAIAPSIRNGRPNRYTYSSTPLLIGLTSACFAHCARPSCAPLAAPSLSPSLGSSYRLRFAGPVFRGCGALRAVPQFSMVVPLRSQARLRHSLLHWAYYGLFRAQRAASVRPSPLHPFGASTATACFAPLRAAFVRPAVHAAGDDYTAKGLPLRPIPLSRRYFPFSKSWRKSGVRHRPNAGFV